MGSGAPRLQEAMAVEKSRMINAFLKLIIWKLRNHKVLLDKLTDRIGMIKRTLYNWNKYFFVLLLLAAACSEAWTQIGITGRVSYTNPIIGRKGQAYGGSAGLEFEFDQILSESGTHFYYGIGFTFFTPKPGPHYGTDNFGAQASFSYGKVPMIPLMVGFRQGLIRDAKFNPYLGFNLGYYFTFYEERSSSPIGQNGETFIGGMIGVGPCAGLMVNYGNLISFGFDFRTHFMGSPDASIGFSYIDTGIFVNLALE
jgi:hypothetical protein